MTEQTRLKRGAAIIPFARVEGQLCFLLHKTYTGRRKGLLVDFGGGSQAGESLSATAAREFVEETEGMYLGDRRGLARMPVSLFQQQCKQVQQQIESGLAEHPDWRCPRPPGKRPREWQTFFVAMTYRAVDEINRAWRKNRDGRYRKRRHLIWVPASELLEIFRTRPEQLWTRLREYQGVEAVVQAIRGHSG